jgi:hypothetical protein
MDMNVATAPGRAYGQMFANLGKIAGDSIEKYAEGKKKKEEQDELIKGTKSFIMGNPELGKMLNIQATDGISYEEAVNQAVPSLVKNPKGFEMIKGLNAMANQQQQNDIILDKFNREEKEREANTLLSQYQMGTKTGAVPALGTITDPNEYARVAEEISNIENNPFLTNLLAKGISPRVTQAETLGAARKKFRTEKKEKKQTTTSGFRKEFNALPEVKAFSKVRSAYNKVKVSGEDPSPAGDLSLIFNYMKILDPGSVVREGEFANAQNAGGIDTKIRNFYNQVVDGTRLSAEQRQDFLNQARNAASAEFVGLNDQMNRYRNIATRNKLSIDDILPDNLLSIQEELNTPIMTPSDEDDVDDASKRALQSTPSAASPPSSQPNQGRQSAQNIILQKAQNGEPLTPKEQQIFDLLQKQQAQKINP